jgi:amino acid transporter
LGLRDSVATSVGLPFAALEYLAAASLVVYVAGDMAWLAIATATLLVLATWGLFGELNGLFPTAAGIRLWMTRSFSDRISLTLTFTYLVTIVAVIAADAFIVGDAVAHTLGNADWVAVVYVVLAIGAAMTVNLRGITLAGGTQQAITVIVIAGSLVVALLAIAFGDPVPASERPGSTGFDTGFLQAVALGVFLFAGFEWVTTTAEETRDPARTVPRAMLIAIAVLFVVTTVIALAMSRLLDAGQLDSVHPQLFLGEAALGTAGLWLMMVVTSLTAINTFNGGFITASRFLYATAREGNLPERFALLNGRAVPWLPVVALAAIALGLALLVAVTGGWKVLVAVGAALEAFLFAVTAICVLRLRRTMPGAERPFRAVGGTVVPVLVAAIFAVLAVAASTTVDEKTNVLPAAIILGVAGVAALYSITVAPRMRAAQAARRRVAGRERRERRRALRAGERGG